MKKFTLLLSAVLLACATNLWAGDVVVYQLNTASDQTPIATETDKYSSIAATDCNSAAKDSEISSAKWKVTLGSNSTSNPKGLWLGSNKNNTSSQTLGNGNFAEAEYIAKAIGIATDVTNVVALISETELPNISKVNFACNKYYNKTPKQIWILASEDRGTTWNVAATATDVKTDSTFTFDAPIASARYALVCYYPSAYFNVRVPVLTFYKTVSDAKTVSVAVAEGQEDMGSVAMSYKANSTATEWTEANEPVEIAGEGAEEFQFVATPADGYKFAGWTTTGDITLIDKNAATTEGGLATETSVVTANFERNATLQSLTISGAATKVTYVAGDTFDPAGLVVTATYSDKTEDVVTDQVDWTFDPSTLDEATTIVSVSATFKETNSAPFAVNVTVLSAPKTITIDLSKNETTTATAETLEWKGTILTITSSRTSSSTTAANNYYGGDTQKHTSTRFYKNNTLTFTPADGITLRTITYTATTAGYATLMAKSTWTNATATAKTDAEPYIVTITPTDGKAAVSATIYDTTGGKSFEIKYLGEAKPTAIESAAVETPAIKTIENGQLVILRDGVKYNAMGVRLQ